MRYRFGRAELRTRQRELLVDGVVVDLGGRAFDLLQILIEQRDRVVSARELLALTWPGLSVQPNNLQVQVWTLRARLGPEIIATVPRRGYRFTAPVEVFDNDVAVPAYRALPSAPDDDGAAAAAWRIEVASIASQLREHWLVTLVGPDAGGRRRLAWAAAQQLGRHDIGGAWFLESASLVAPLEPADLPGSETFLDRLGRRAALVVLFEAHRAAAPVRTLLGRVATRAPTLRWLVTSRSALGLPDEHVVPTSSRLGSDIVPQLALRPQGLPRWRLRSRGT